MVVYHNSWDERYRFPFGAVECGGKIKLCVKVSEAEMPACFIRLWQNGSGEKLVEMEREREERDFIFKAVIKAPDKAGLLWYQFIVKDGDEIIWYGNNEQNSGGEGKMYFQEAPSFQITVYKSYKIPKWYKNGIVYQIFPDRFNRGSDYYVRARAALGKKKESGTKKILQSDWGDVPFYSKNADGEITRWAFFGGTLKGIEEKLEYLKSLGVSGIYLNPIFASESNHRYSTGDYTKIDSFLGDEESFKSLAERAENRGIKIILDGVFSHTGAESVYFDKFGECGGNGAFLNENSTYGSWYKFKNDGEYECWWGNKDLPNVDENDESFSNFICGGGGIIEKWLALGAEGWRLDVADELPDSFIEKIRQKCKDVREESVIIGEVWEDASNKISYGEERKYLSGDELDSVMNYPQRKNFIDFLLFKADGEKTRKRQMSLKENYPKESLYGALNIIGSHDRKRILTVLGEAPDDLTDIQKEYYKLPPEKKALGVRRLKMITLLQYTAAGVPCIYYGDEAGAEGYEDPYNRGTFPWGKEDDEIMEHYKMLGNIYSRFDVLKDGSYLPISYGTEVYGCVRENEKEKIAAVVNRSRDLEIEIEIIGEGYESAVDILSEEEYLMENGSVFVKVKPLSGVLLLMRKEKTEN